MNRRTLLASLGATAAGSGALVSTGAFSSVRADRDVTVSVAGDAAAYLRLAPCTIDGEQHPNGDYVVTDNGTIALDFTEDNANVPGDGVNAEALTVFHNVFEVCNQGTQPVCVDVQVDVPEIPKDADVPDRYDFGPGNPAVVFYKGDDREATLGVDELDADREGAIALDVSECQCIGMEVRAFGFDTGRDLFEDADLRIRAEAGANCLGEEFDARFADLRSISFVAFCPEVSVTNIDVIGRNTGGEPVAIEWEIESDDSPDEVLLRGGPELYRFEVDSEATSGRAVMSNDEETFDYAGELLTDDFTAPPRYEPEDSDYVRCPRSPCLGEEGTKIEEEDDDLYPDDAETTDKKCPHENGGECEHCTDHMDN